MAHVDGAAPTAAHRDPSPPHPGAGVRGPGAGPGRGPPGAGPPVRGPGEGPRRGPPVRRPGCGEMASAGGGGIGYRCSGKGVDGDSCRSRQPGATRGWCEPGGRPADQITPEPPEEQQRAGTPSAGWPASPVEPAARHELRGSRSPAEPRPRRVVPRGRRRRASSLQRSRANGPTSSPRAPRRRTTHHGACRQQRLPRPAAARPARASPARVGPARASPASLRGGGPADAGPALLP